MGEKETGRIGAEGKVKVNKPAIYLMSFLSLSLSLLFLFLPIHFLLQSLDLRATGEGSTEFLARDPSPNDGHGVAQGGSLWCKFY